MPSIVNEASQEHKGCNQSNEHRHQLSPRSPGHVAAMADQYFLAPARDGKVRPSGPRSRVASSHPGTTWKGWTRGAHRPDPSWYSLASHQRVDI
jgi:hypothetical protein